MFVFRAWFSIPDDLRDPEGHAVNAVYGYARFLGELLEDRRPAFAAATFDESLATSFRNQLYPAYKANREPAPPELKLQFARCRQVARALGLPVWSHGEFEADDLIGTLAARQRAAGREVTILSRDKDLAQALQPGDHLWDYPTGRKLSYYKVREAYGVDAGQIADYLALVGDSVDNIPGVRGVGPKTAAALLRRFTDLDGVYGDLAAAAELNVRGAAALPARLAEHREAAFLARSLTRLRCDVPVPDAPDPVARSAPDLDALDAIYDAAGFGEGLRRQARRIAESFDPAAAA